MAKRKLAKSPDDIRDLSAAQALRGAPSGTYSRAAILRVRTTPDPVLSRRSEEVDPRDPSIVALSHALVATMRASPACVGLAAPQVGELVRLFCMDVTGHRKAKSCAGLVVMVNPRIVAHTELVMMREGCMSVPDLTGNVWRADELLVEGIEPGTARLLRVTADGIEARCIQHEIDHLDGKLFVDRVRDSSSDLFSRKSYA
ncbi:MAG: peptide deformylase [Labilithrix sp.]|nr:peptide deformylase [Labilithrix sp.]